MENIDSYFNELNSDISNAQTKKALKVFSKRAKRLYKGFIDNAMTDNLKKYITKQYRNSTNLIKKMNSKITV